MSDLDGLINLIPIGDIAKKLGIDENVAKAAVAVAVPAIVGGLAANAKTDTGAQKLQAAVEHHDKKVSVDDVDVEDGQKIVKHVFGAKADDVAAAAGAKAGGPDIGAIVAQVLPIIAPIVLAFLAQQMTKGGSSTAAAPKAEEPAAATAPTSAASSAACSRLSRAKTSSVARSAVLGGGPSNWALRASWRTFQLRQ